MDVIDAIYARRAVKHFDPSHRLTAEEERRLLEATIQAPTSFNIQHWRFVILRDPGSAGHDPPGLRQRSGPDHRRLPAGSLHRRHEGLEQAARALLGECSAACR